MPDVRGELQELEVRSNLGEWRALTVIVPFGVMAAASLIETIVVNAIESAESASATHEYHFRVLGDLVHGSGMLFGFGLVWFAADQVSRVHVILGRIPMEAPRAAKHAAWLRAFAIGLIVCYFVSFGLDLVVALAPVKLGWERWVLSTTVFVANILIIASAYFYGTAALKIVRLTVKTSRDALNGSLPNGAH